MSTNEKEGEKGDEIPPVARMPIDSTDAILWITYTNIVLYALCYQLQRPVEPYLIESLTEQEKAEGLLSSTSSVNQTYGNLQSFFSFCQMFGSPLVGILLDRIGIRKTSCVVFVASALSYAILASASDLTLLFVSKIPTVFQAAFLVAQATAATTTGDNAALRAAALGRMTTAYTIGATIGPALGGYLAGQGDFYIGAKLAVAGSLLSAILSLMYLPDHSVAPDPSKSSGKKRSFLEATYHSGQIAMRSSIWPLLTVKVIGGVCASMHSTAIPLVLTQVLHFEPQQLGLVMSCGMFAVAFFGAFFMAPLAKILGSFGMMFAGILSRSVLGLLMAGIVTTYATMLSGNDSTNSAISVEFVLTQVIIVSILHALSQHVLATGLTTQTTGSVDNDEQGALLGLEHSLFSLARIGGPAIGTALFGLGGVLPVEMACGSIDVLTTAFLSITLRRFSKKDP
jgi:OCT family organic cation transporter-like MFS transporter 18